MILHEVYGIPIAKYLKCLWKLPCNLINFRFAEVLDFLRNSPEAFKMVQTRNSFILRNVWIFVAQ